MKLSVPAVSSGFEESDDDFGFLLIKRCQFVGFCKIEIYPAVVFAQQFFEVYYSIRIVSCADVVLALSYNLCKDAEQAVDDGYNYIILTDKETESPSLGEGLGWASVVKPPVIVLSPQQCLLVCQIRIGNLVDYLESALIARQIHALVH